MFVLKDLKWGIGHCEVRVVQRTQCRCNVTYLMWNDFLWPVWKIREMRSDELIEGNN